MHECTSIIMNSFHLFLIFFSLRLFISLIFFKQIVHRGGGQWGRGWGGGGVEDCVSRSFKKQTKTNKEKGCQTYLHFF